MKNILVLLAMLMALPAMAATAPKPSIASLQQLPVVTLQPYDEAANADEAIEVLESRTDITVVFTDIQMPGSMDGLKLARAVRGRWPPIKIIATSGRLHLDEADLPEGGRFLPKPYSPSQVTGVLRELIMR